MQTLSIQAGPYSLNFHEKTHVMGILNTTPDSFSDGGQFNTVEQAINHTARMVKEGADVIDIGGESTRPGATKIEEAEELERVIPIIEALSSRFDLPLSIDTYKSEVACQAIRHGAHMINDVWGAKHDPHIAQVAQETGAPIILMHNRPNQVYTHLISDMFRDLQVSIDIAQKAGVSAKQIMIDPGIGFAKSMEDNFVVMSQLEKFVALGYPVVLGTSRKSMIGKILDLPAEERVEGTLATVCLGMTKGCQMVRVHDVKATVRTVKMMDAMLGKRGSVL